MYRRHIYKLARTRLDDVLLDEGVLERSILDDVQAEAGVSGAGLVDLLIARELIDEWDLAKVVARHYSLPFIDVSSYSISREAEAVLPTEFCVRHRVLPFDVLGDTYTLAVAEMPSIELLDELAQASDLTPFIYVALTGKILDVLAKRDPSAVVVAPKSPPTAAPKPASVEGPAPPATGVAAEPASQPARRRQDLQPVSMRLGFTMTARVGGKSAERRPVAMSAARVLGNG